MRNELIDSIAATVKHPVTMVNAGALGFTMMDIEIGLKVFVLVLTAVWTILKIKNELKNKN